MFDDKVIHAGFPETNNRKIRHARKEIKNTKNGNISCLRTPKFNLRYLNTILVKTFAHYLFTLSLVVVAIGGKMFEMKTE